jgi:hypothetical protein
MLTADNKRQRTISSFFIRASELKENDQDLVTPSDLATRQEERERISSVSDTSSESNAEIPSNDNPEQGREIQSTTVTQPLPKCNILSQLHRYSLTGARVNHQRPSFSHCPWLVLKTPQPVTTMAFDQQGVLLAVATEEKRVLVWDWDTVVASDFQGRRDNRKDNVPSILNLKVPHMVKHMQWDDEDGLLIGFRGHSSLRLYDMATVTESGHSTTYLQIAAPSLIPSCQGPSCVKLLPNRHIVAAYPSQHLVLWKLQDSYASIMWNYSLPNPETVSTVDVLSQNWILLGTLQGSFIILDWTLTTRKAFSSDKTPTIIAHIATPPLLAKALTKNMKTVPALSPAHSSIQAVTLLNHQMKHLDRTTNMLGSCRVTWVTSGGFVLSIDLLRRRSLEIHYQPPVILNLSAESGVLRPGEHFCHPLACRHVLTAACSGQCLVWQGVSQVTHVLPNHDQRICQQRDIQQDDGNRTLHILHPSQVRNQEPQSLLRLPKLPTGILVHPNGEWMIVSTDSNKLKVMNARL